MARTIIVDGGEKIACPKCNHGFPLSEGISRQTIERYAEDFERSVAAHRRKLEAELAAEAKAQFEQQRKAMNEALSAKEGALARFRSEELQLRRSLLELGSQQLQGEALELSLEALLRNAFPLDEIVPVPKGMNGADLLQHVHSPSGHCCGTIIWEAKQTKAWQPAWLRKLKDDQQAIGAELAVIVTAAMPRDGSGKSGEPFMREADVWIVRFDAARPLAEALRAMLLELHKARQANLGRAEKMELVYNYICSPQFTQRVKSVVDGFAAMRQDLEAEKMAVARMFKKRESQLTRMSDGLLGVVGDLQGIGQESLAQLDSIAALPVPLEDEVQE